MRRSLVLLLLGAIAIVGYGVYKTLQTPADLYIVTKGFAGCPARASCVSSAARNDEQRVPALGYTSDPYFALLMLREVIERMGGEIQHETPEYLHAVFSSPTLRLRDDLELLIVPDGRIEVRSASRLGWGRLGSGRHRARVEELRRAFEAMP